MAQELKKAQRILLVWQTVKDNKRANADTIFRHVAHKIQGDYNDRNLKRKIYRDLNDLVQRYEINVDYFTPDGQIIDEYDETTHKNVRTEYYIPGDEGDFLGSGLLKNSIYQFIPQRRNNIDWTVSPANESFIANNQKAKIILHSPTDELYIIAAFSTDLPFSILMARQPEEKELQLTTASLEAHFGHRTSAIIFEDKSVSRWSEAKKSGHCLIEWKEPSKATLTDYTEAKKTNIYDISGQYIDDLVSQHSSFATKDNSRNVSDQSISNQSHQTADKPRELTLPKAIKVGATYLYLIL